MNGPTDHERDDLAGDLATVTDDEWREAHERLTLDLIGDCGGPEQVDEVARQMTYVWSPGAPARTGGDAHDVAPLAGQWDGRLPGGE